MVSVDAEIVNLPLECHTEVSAVEFFFYVIYMMAPKHGPLVTVSQKRRHFSPALSDAKY